MVVYICIFKDTNDIAMVFEHLEDAEHFVANHKARCRLSILSQKVMSCKL